MAYIWSYLKRYPNWLWLDLLGAMLFVTVILGMPTALAGMIDNGVTKGDRTGVYLWTFIMFIFVVLGIIGRITMAYASSRLTTTMIRDMRNDMYAKLQEYSHHEYEQIGVSSLVTRMTSDTFVLMQFAEMSLRLGLVTPMVMIFSVVMILITSPSLAWLVAVAMPLLVGVVLYVAIKTKPLSERQQTMLDKINQYVRENLTGLRVVRAFARENFQSQKFQVANQRYTDTSTGLFKLTGLTEPLFVQIIIAMIVAIVWFALDPLQRGAIKIGDLVAFIEYSFHALFSFLLFANLFTMYPRMVVSSHRIREVMDMPISINPNAEGVTDTKLKGHLEFDNVTFAYPGETESPVLHDISFKAKPGETIAFIGSTGSGKSTLVNLVPRFYDATEGAIKLDGIDIKEYSHNDLNNKIGYIPQKAVLFSGTVRSNMILGESGREELSDEEIWQALELAQAKEFIEAKEKGLDTEVAQGGSNFSGGQKQRLAIARALARHPEILIFDDSFSALDYKTDHILRHEVKEKTAAMTKLIVAQRISTIMDADLILVLDQGKVVGQGTHKELLSNNEVYQEIAYSQLSKEELENEN
ncbi:ABC transporter ATP-binding protein [Streptococcus agalactiae]|nr:ABC transporter ATP-binding protein [Streptococcus agalactiae]